MKERNGMEWKCIRRVGGWLCVLTIVGGLYTAQHFDPPRVKVISFEGTTLQERFEKHAQSVSLGKSLGNLLAVQEARADSIAFAASPTAVSTTKMWSAPYSRLRMAILEADTAGVHLKVPGMSNGDYVVSASYVPWDTLEVHHAAYRYPIDLTDSALVYRDSIQFNRPLSIAIDSGWYYILWNDATD
jgi:hypothetical protein